MNEGALAAPALRRRSLTRAVTTELTGSLDVRRTALRLHELLRPAFVDWVVVAVTDSRGGGFTCFGGDDLDLVVGVDPAQGAVLDAVLREEESRLVRLGEDAEPAQVMGDPALADQLARHDDVEVYVVPLGARGSLVGALFLARTTADGFTEDDLDLADEVGQRAALALDAARVQQDHARVGSVLETSLRPPALPEAPEVSWAACFRPAAEHLEISGDFYDVHGAAGDWLVTLGDVCGKGVEAAVLNGRARQSIRTAAYFDRRPAGILEALDSVLQEEHSERFVTVACTRVRPAADGALRVDAAVAGHPPPLVLRADGSVETADVSGPLAGVLPGRHEYDQTSLDLRPGDTMLLFSDGIYEARGNGGIYGFDRLEQQLSARVGARPEELCRGIEQDVVEYLAGHAHDDMTLFALAPRGA